PVLTVIKDTILPAKDDAPASTGPSTLTREKIEAYGLALIRARIGGEDVSNLLTGTSLNDGYVTYVSSFRQTITMLGSLVTSTRGLGGDLLAVRHDANDPIASLTPVSNWPTTLTRDYRFPGAGPTGKVISVNCELTKGEITKFTQVETTYDVTSVTEHCVGEAVTFTNTYMTETLTGQVWHSQQWVGFEVGHLNVEVLEPITID
ncbi:MAG: YjbF family lipoprotein, partial [Alphaproteobacteria bacterium]